ncbi:MAG TPA: hypothetical protein VF679_02585 [Pedobacter sp.]
MKTNLIAGVIIALITLQSCKKKETIEEEKPPMKLLTRVITASQAGAVFEYYTYDDKHRLKTHKSGTSVTTYNYSNDDLVTIEETSSVSGPLSKYDLTYNSGKIIQAAGKQNNKQQTYGYVYIGNDLSEIHVKEDGVVVAKLTYTIVNHNITKIVKEYPGATYITENTYGTHKNMFFNARISQINGIEELLGSDSYDKYSVNDLLESKLTFPDGNIVKTVNTYTYDEDGLPLTLSSAQTLSTAPNTFVGKYTFEYELVK